MVDRLEYQRLSVEKYSSQLVLNVGSYNDPAALKGTFGDRVINCDTNAGENVDKVFDCTEDTWPFPDDSVDLVVFGDVIEHFYPDECIRALREAHRVAKYVCITVPEDERVLDEGYTEAIEGTSKGLVHVHLVTEKYMKRQLFRTSWRPVDWNEIDYGFVPRGFLIVAERIEPKE